MIDLQFWSRKNKTFISCTWKKQKLYLHLQHLYNNRSHKIKFMKKEKTTSYDSLPVKSNTVEAPFVMNGTLDLDESKRYTIYRLIDTT